jgi:hypothetical protein
VRERRLGGCSSSHWGVGLVCCARAVRCPDWGSNEKGWSEGEKVEDPCKILPSDATNATSNQHETKRLVPMLQVAKVCERERLVHHATSWFKMKKEKTERCR